MVFSNKNVLIVDDEDVQFDLIKTGLKDLGCNFIFATNGREGLAAVDKAIPDLVITDLIMLEMTGLEMIRSLYERGIKVPTIVMTGFASVRAIKEAQALGVSEFVEKPLQIGSMKILVSKLLGSESATLNPVVAVDNQFSLRIQLDEEFFAKVQDYCQKEGLSVSTLVKGLLKRKIEGINEDW